MSIDLDKLSGVVNALAASVVHHDDQIEKLIASVVHHDDQIEKLIAQVSRLAKVGEGHEAQIAELRRSVVNTERLLEAYLKRLPPQ